MREGIKIGEIRKALKYNKRLTEPGGYEKKEEQWGMYDSSLEEFEKTFWVVLPKDFQNKPKVEREILGEYIEETLSKGEKHDLTAVEFGGSGSNLFRGFSSNFFKKTVGICLKDIRNQGVKDNDKSKNHSVIVGDITDVKNNQLFDKISQILGTNKIDLIISRVEGPLEFIKKHPAILDRIIRNWYNILNKNGLLFVQFERPIDTFIVGGSIKNQVIRWATAIKERFPEVDIQTDGRELRLHKKNDAPDELPRAKELFK